MVATKVIEIVIVVIVVALLFPIAGTLIFNANTTGWDSTSVTVFGYVFILALVAVLIILLTSYIRHGKG
jgi:flagellar biosynthesis protein FliP